MEHAQKELAKVCYPQFEMSIDLINFTTNYDYIKYTEQLGNIITIEWEPGILIEARILEMDIDWDKSDNFTLKFSNKNSLDDKWSLLSEIKKQANSTASSVDYNKGAWNIAKQTSIDFKQWKGSILDASLQALQNSANQEVLIDETGIILRRWLPDQNTYSPNQIWMTNGQIAFSKDGWKSVCQALGEITLPDGHTVYGLVGEYIIGEIFVGETLRLRGSGAELDLSANVAITDLENKNVEFSVTINEFKSEYSAYKKEMNGTIENINTSIRQNEQAIILEANKRSEADNGIRSDYTAKFEINANAISAEVSRATKAEDLLESDYNAKFKINADEIAAEVSRATKAEGNLSSSIKVNADNIELKVNKNGVISAINISPETVKIKGKKIQLDGEVTFSNTNKFKLEPNTTTINGGCIKSGTIDASVANIQNINASNINTGSFNASLIKTGTLDAENITVRNLVVGKNVSMGSNATISWKNVTGTDNVAELGDIPNDEYITQITKNTVTTEYVNALSITAGSVSADNISGGLIKGVTALFVEDNGAYWACGATSLSEAQSGSNCDWICDTRGLSGYNKDGNTIRDCLISFHFLPNVL